MRLSTPRAIVEPSAVRKRCLDDSASSSSGDDASSDTNAVLRGYKKHARYVPDVSVPMTKEQLSAWRKAARRVRNRESAAASRQKTRSRIEELECEVDTLQEKYMKALQRISDLENGVSGSFTPARICQDMIQLGLSTSAGTTFTHREPSATVSPPQSPRSEPLLNSEDLDQPQHMDMFSRSTDV